MKQLAEKIRETAAAVEFSGVVSIFREALPVFSEAFGYRDVKEKLPNTTNTLFGIASGTKLFTALGIGVLIDQGRIALDTAVGKIDSAYKGFVDEQATVQQLLTHTSGIYDYYDEEIEEDFENFSVAIPWSALETPSDYYPLFGEQVMKFRPGERYAYSNGGYVFLGILIEKLTGMLYREFIEAHVLQAAEMHRSGFYAFNNLPENTANGYLSDRVTTNIYKLPMRGGGDGGMFTTSDELAVFWRNLFAHKILSAELTKTYLQTHWAFNEINGYGCGLYKRLNGGRFAIEGSDAGVDFYSAYLPNEQLTVNVISNLTDGDRGLTDAVFELL